MVQSDRVREDRRTRNRRATMEDLKAAALDEVRERGPAGVSLRSVARRMGMSASGLFRYVASREELLTILITDGYHDFADHLYVADGGGARPADSPVTDRPQPRPLFVVDGTDDVAERARAVLLAYRQWAVEHPKEFALLFGDPIPGYAAPVDGPTTRGMRRLGAALAGPVLDAWRLGRLRVHPALGAADLADALAPMAGDDLNLGGHRTPQAVHALLLTTWGRVHGQVSLEVFGHHAWIFPEGCEPLFRAEVEAMLADLGLVSQPGA
ncbi:MAG: TetR/AcrR family transcriptional regulator [Actinomycetota bacterium]